MERNKKTMKYLGLIIIMIFIFSCGDKRTPIQGKTEFQKSLNALFKDASSSPLKDEDRKSFTGLDFFEVDSSYVVNAIIERSSDSSWTSMRTTTDRVVEHRRYGTVNFKIRHKELSLTIYQPKENLKSNTFSKTLFLPFLDNTNGESTYEGGRYLDVEFDGGDSILVDFNKAYNPYCVYNKNYSCPIVPRINHLDIAIEAGMKNWKK